MSFNELNIIDPILKALKAQGYQDATPIQQKAIPPLLAGSDLLGCAQTGTGKTAAFAIPILQQLASKQSSHKGQRKIKALVIAPTRELALQIGDSFKLYGRNLKQRTAIVFGGVSQHPQTRQLRQGIDILVATPGRLLDLINQGFINIGEIEHFVLDEADQMLDMGMLQDVKKIIAYIPKQRQTMFFSATMPTEIAGLADTILNNPVKIIITPEFSPIDIIDQEVYFVDNSNKTNLLINLLKGKDYDSVLIFSRTKHGADKIVRDLNNKGFMSVAIHGNKSQSNRQLALSNFKKRKTRILVATDIAARGLDIEELSHVINYNLPEVPETYIHRIGRTGRAGLGGKAIAFCDYGEKPLLRDIQKLIDKTLPEVTDHPFPLVNTSPKPKTKQRSRSAAQTGSAKPQRAQRSQRSNRPQRSSTSKGAKTTVS